MKWTPGIWHSIIVILRYALCVRMMPGGCNIIVSLSVVKGSEYALGEKSWKELFSAVGQMKQMMVVADCPQVL